MSSTFQMFWWSSSVLSIDPANFFIQLEVFGQLPPLTFHLRRHRRSSSFWSMGSCQRKVTFHWSIWYPTGGDIHLSIPLMRSPSSSLEYGKLPAQGYSMESSLNWRGHPSVHSIDLDFHAVLSMRHIYCGIYIWRHPKIELLRMRERINLFICACASSYSTIPIYSKINGNTRDWTLDSIR